MIPTRLPNQKYSSQLPSAMTILMVHNAKIPASNYDGAERVLWWLGRQLCQMGHSVRYLVKKGSSCSFATVIPMDEKKPISEQIPEDTDLVHFHFQPKETIEKPHLVTQHRCLPQPEYLSPNSVFVSAHQAAQFGSTQFVHYGIDFSEYGKPNLSNSRYYFHFMGNAAKSGKNVKGAIELARKINARLHVIGGTRVNFRQGLRVTLSPSARFHGVLLPDGRNAILNGSKGMIFPVLCHVPFGLSVAESLWFGCPLFGTPYGALPELLGREPRFNLSMNQQYTGSVEAFYSDYGFLSIHKSEILDAMIHAESYQAKLIHDYAAAYFGIEKMADKYLNIYEKILNGAPLHPSRLLNTCQPEAKPLPLLG